LPTAAAALVVIVIVVLPLPVTLFGLKLAVTPEGKPLTEKLLVPVKPLSAVIVTVYGMLLPATTFCEDGEAPTLKSGGSVTTRVTTELCVRLPLVPVTVSGYVPAGVLELVVTVSVLEPLAVTVAGLNANVVPAGNPVTLIATSPVNPFRAPMFTV
jgi:hypothetical protein